MVFNATFNNISVISWWSVLLVVETASNTIYNIMLDRAPCLRKYFHICDIFTAEMGAMYCFGGNSMAIVIFTITVCVLVLIY